MSGFYPEFEDSREVQLGSLAAIGFLLQIRDLLGDIDRFEKVRSIQIFPVGSIQIFPGTRPVRFKFFLETENGEKKPNLI